MQSVDAHSSEPSAAIACSSSEHRLGTPGWARRPQARLRRSPAPVIVGMKDNISAHQGAAAATQLLETLGYAQCNSWPLVGSCFGP